MEHGEHERVVEPGSGDDQRSGRSKDRGSGGEGQGELAYTGGAQLDRGGRFPTSGDAEPRDTGPLTARQLELFEFSSHQGPLPPASLLADYDAMVPGLAKDLADAALANMASDRMINETQVQTAKLLDLRGQRFAFALCAVCVALAAVCLFALHPAWFALSAAGLFGLGAAAPVVNAFLQRGGD